jgi:hypothetical protein
MTSEQNPKESLTIYFEGLMVFRKLTDGTG